MKLKICPQCGAKNMLTKGNCTECHTLLRLETIVEISEEELFKNPELRKFEVRPSDILHLPVLSGEEQSFLPKWFTRMLKAIWPFELIVAWILASSNVLIFWKSKPHLVQSIGIALLVSTFAYGIGFITANSSTLWEILEKVGVLLDTLSIGMLLVILSFYYCIVAVICRYFILPVIFRVAHLPTEEIPPVWNV